MIKVFKKNLNFFKYENCTSYRVNLWFFKDFFKN